MAYPLRLHQVTSPILWGGCRVSSTRQLTTVLPLQLHKNTVGDLRYQRPQPVQAWGSREAILYAPACYQHNDTFTVLNKVSEDCLYLNVI